MAVDADATEQLSRGDSQDTTEDGAGPDVDGSLDQHDSVDADVGTPLSPWRSPQRLAVVACAVMVVGLAAMAGWLGYDTHHRHQAERQRALFVEVAKQGAINLTTINYTEVDNDVQRILDSSTGTFHDDFQKRAQPFIDVVKQVRSKSTGAITAAALESQDGDQAQILVSVAVKTSTDAAPQQQPRRWRMRINVERNGDSAKVSNVEFVP